MTSILETAAGVALGLVIVGAIAVAAVPVILPMIQKQGMFSYNGLSREQILAVYKQMDSRAKILSRTCGSHGTGHQFCRGIYLGGAATYPLYYRYEIWPDGRTAFDLYPMVMERWSTDPDVGRKTGTVVFPQPYGITNHIY